MSRHEDLRIDWSGEDSVAGLLDVPGRPLAAFVFAHGAGAGMHHRFMNDFAMALCARGVAVLRYQFPFMEKGSRRPDVPKIAHAAVRAAVDRMHRELPDVRLFAGGKSFGGRMTSQAQAIEALPRVEGLVFVGFPLHPAGKPSIERAQHLAAVMCPMLFLQGTRDDLADLDLLRPIFATLGGNATLVVVDDADHAFHVRMSSGTNDGAVLEHLADETSRWMLLDRSSLVDPRIPVKLIELPAIQQSPLARALLYGGDEGIRPRKRGPLRRARRAALRIPSARRTGVLLVPARQQSPLARASLYGGDEGIRTLDPVFDRMLP